MASPRKFVRLLTCSCDEITRMVSESLDRDLPRAERWAVRIHLVYCKGCRRCRRQLRFLKEAVDRCLADPEGLEHASITLSPEARKRLEQAIARR